MKSIFCYLFVHQIIFAMCQYEKFEYVVPKLGRHVKEQTMFFKGKFGTIFKITDDKMFANLKKYH